MQSEDLRGSREVKNHKSSTTRAETTTADIIVGGGLGRWQILVLASRAPILRAKPQSRPPFFNLLFRPSS